MATTSLSLLDWIISLLRDPEARAEFQKDPDGYAAEQGFDNLSSADVRDSLCLVADNQPAHGDHARYLPLPPDSDSDSDDNDNAAQYLNRYITNNYQTIEKNETNIDNSIHQDVDTDGGDFDQIIDNDPVIASGDGAVVAGDDIRDSALTTGDDNVVGDNNQAVTGDDNTAAFGSGDASNASFEDTEFGDGSGLSVGGDASGASSDNDTSTDVRNSGEGDTSVNAAGDSGYANQDSDQSSTDDSTHTSYEDSSRTDSHDQLNSGNDSRYEDSYDTEISGV